MQQIMSIIKNENYHKPVTIIATLLAMLVLILIGNLIINRVFNDERTPLTKVLSDDDKKRIVTLNKMIKAVWKAVVIVIGAVNILSLFIDVKAILTVAGVGTLAIGIGAKAIVEDMLSGFVILFENQFCVGDYVELDGGHYGCVEHINLRTTQVRQLDQSLYIVHNGQISNLTNFSKGSVRAMVHIGVAFEEQYDSVCAVLNALFEKLGHDYPDLYLQKPEIMGVDELEASAVMIRVEADVKAENKLCAERDLRCRIKRALDENNIEIPYSKHVLINAKDPEEI